MSNLKMTAYFRLKFTLTNIILWYTGIPKIDREPFLCIFYQKTPSLA